jgi:hypothetical protein
MSFQLHHGRFFVRQDNFGAAQRAPRVIIVDVRQFDVTMYGLGVPLIVEVLRLETFLMAKASQSDKVSQWPTVGKPRPKSCRPPTNELEQF